VRLSEQEAASILMNSRKKSFNVFLLDVIVLMEKPGRYKIRATVYESDPSARVSGEALIIVK